MKNKVLTIIMSGLIIFSLTGCIAKEEYKDSQQATVQQNNRFQKTGEYYYIDNNKFEIVEDTKTKCLYLYNSKKVAYYTTMNLIPLYDENEQIAKSK